MPQGGPPPASRPRAASSTPRARGSSAVRLRHRALPERDLASVSLGRALLGARLDRAARRLRDDGRHRRGGRDQPAPGARRRRGTASRSCSARAAGCSTTRRCCAPTGPTRPSARRCCWPTSAPRRCAGRAGPSAPSGCVELLDADGLSIHLNPLQEAVQPEGEPDFTGVLDGDRRLPSTRLAPRPVVVKEVGFGLDPADVAAAARRGRRRGRRRRRGRDELGADRGPPRPARGRRRRRLRRLGRCRRPTRCAGARGRGARAAGHRLGRRARRRRGREVPRARRARPAGSPGRSSSPRRPTAPARRSRPSCAQLRIAVWAAGAPRRRRARRGSTCDEGRASSAPASAGSRAALRLQGAGHDVTVVEQRAAAGRPRLPAQRRRLHVGHGPVADHDAVGARGDLRGGRPRPRLRGRRCAAWTRSTGSTGPARSATSTSPTTATACATRSRASPRATPRRLDDFLAALKPIYEDGDRRAPGRRPFLLARRLRPPHAEMVRLGALLAAAPLRLALLRARARARGVLLPLAVHRRRPATACPRSTARSSTCRCSTAAGTPRAASTRWSRRWRAPLDVRCGAPVEAIEHARRARRRACALRGGERVARRRRGLQRRRPARARAARPPRAAAAPAARRCRCFLLYLGTDRAFERLLHHTLLVGHGLPRLHPRRSRAGAALPTTYSTYVHAPARTEAAMARRGRRLAARPAARPEPARGHRLGARGRRAARRGGARTSRRPSA